MILQKTQNNRFRPSSYQEEKSPTRQQLTKPLTLRHVTSETEVGEVLQDDISSFDPSVFEVASAGANEEDCDDNGDDYVAANDKIDDNLPKLEDLCESMDVTPANLLQFDTDEENDDLRGVYLKSSVTRGDVILSIPLHRCLVDNTPPGWLSSFYSQMDDDDDDDDGSYNQSRWATCLAASVVELQMKNQKLTSSDVAGEPSAHSLWLSMLPNAEFLKASLPVHWTDETLRNARCTALELAVDSSYFSRGQAVEELIQALKQRHRQEEEENKSQEESTVADFDERYWREMCSNALDLVQTRSCRLEPISADSTTTTGITSSSSDDGSGIEDGDENLVGSRPIRVLAPIFDFINHAPTTYRGNRRHVHAANAEFQLEEKLDDDDDDDTSIDRNNVDANNRNLHLVVRAKRDIQAKEEVLIDYGHSTKPAWTCLLSYGFVPSSTTTRANEKGMEYLEDDNDDIGNYDDGDDSNVAEVFVDGCRFEVSPTTIPVDLVSFYHPGISNDESPTFAQDNRNELVLTAAIARKIAKRLSDAAYYLLLEPPAGSGDDSGNVDEYDGRGGKGDDAESSNSSSRNITFWYDVMCDDHPSMIPTPFQVISNQLAANLRWSQHRILLECADGLIEYADSQ